MIELARNQQESVLGQGIQYQVADARQLDSEEPVDLIVAAYLLNYAQNQNELQAMCAGLARCLKPGGRLVTVNCNPALAFPDAPNYRIYGFETKVSGTWNEGAAITWTFSS